jgi:hypothetical protein
VPGASSETSTPQYRHTNERGNDKSGDLSQQCLEAGQTFRLLSRAPGDAAGHAGGSDHHRGQRYAISQANILAASAEQRFAGQAGPSLTRIAN